MSDETALWTWVHRANIERYRHLMESPLTPVERRFIEQRIAEEEAALRSTGRAPRGRRARIKQLLHVMPAHSRSKNGVASLAYVAGIPLRQTPCQPERGRRDKPGDDGIPESVRPRNAPV